MLSQNIQELDSASPNGEALTLANDVPVMQSPDKIAESIDKSDKVDWKRVGIRSLSFFASVALGALTGLAIAGIMVTPAGWAIAGAALLIALVGAIHCGGVQEFLQALKYTLIGFTTGVGGALAIGGTMLHGSLYGEEIAMASTEIGVKAVAGAVTLAFGLAGIIVALLHEALGDT